MMSAAPSAPAFASPRIPASSVTPQQTNAAVQQKPFDDIFHDQFIKMFQEFRAKAPPEGITAKDRRQIIENAYSVADALFYDGKGPLSEDEMKQRALTRVFYKILADEPWSEDWIRAPDVERKLSRFEWAPGAEDIARSFALYTPKAAIAAARAAIVEAEKKLRESNSPEPQPRPTIPFDDIEVVYVPGTVSSSATAAIDRSTIYPMSVESVAAVLQSHILRTMTRPYDKAKEIIHLKDPEELVRLKKFAESVVDFAPHLLDNDNPSLLIVLLILGRSEICKRFDENGIRVEGSTVSHRRSECMKNKIGWKTQEERKPFDLVVSELHRKIDNVCRRSPRIRARLPRKPMGIGPMTVGNPPVSPVVTTANSTPTFATSALFPPSLVERGILPPGHWAPGIPSLPRSSQVEPPSAPPFVPFSQRPVPARIPNPRHSLPPPANKSDLLSSAPQPSPADPQRQPSVSVVQHPSSASVPQRQPSASAVQQQTPASGPHHQAAASVAHRQPSASVVRGQPSGSIVQRQPSASVAQRQSPASGVQRQSPSSGVQRKPSASTVQRQSPVSAPRRPPPASASFADEDTIHVSGFKPINAPRRVSARTQDDPMEID